MMKNNDKKKGSNTKKILPAAGMLALSASMLATSTYAWFTMSREVEVKNIQMTATVPEDLQISLGHLVGFAGNDAGDATQANASTFGGLAANQGKLAAPANGTADDGNVVAPLTGTDAVSMLDWSNSADISQYYRLGKIMPASSKDGENIYFTPDAAGVGKTLKSGAKYYQAASLTQEFKYQAAVAASGDTPATPATFSASGSGDSAKTKLHAINNVTRASDLWGDSTDTSDTKYVTASEWFETNDDGYYVDIPVWFRSSSTDTINLSVDAYVTTNKAVDEDDLYLAARAVVLYNNTEPAINATMEDSTNLIKIRQDDIANTQSIVNYMYTTNSSGDAVNGTDGSYANAVEYNGAPLIAVPSKAANGDTYGAPTKAIIRVWLEGEDPNCWNQNAGQNFNISLKFSKYDAGSPATAIVRDDVAASTDANSLQNGARATVTSGTDTLIFEYNSTATPKWDLIDGTFHVAAGKTYTFNNATVTNSDEIAAQLEAMGTKASTFAGTLTVSDGT
jgi:hypothetical protein